MSEKIKIVEQVKEAVPDYVSAAEALVNSSEDAERRKDLTLCYVCMQWSCEGPHCHRDDVCKAQDLA